MDSEEEAPKQVQSLCFCQVPDQHDARVLLFRESSSFPELALCIYPAFTFGSGCDGRATSLQGRAPDVEGMLIDPPVGQKDHMDAMLSTIGIVGIGGI